MSKAAIVTGASSGIGLAISRVLCEKGYEVYGFGRDFAKEQTREFVEQTAAFHPVEGDLLEEQKLCDAVKEISKTADIEVLVNAAGVGHYGLHEELTPKKIQALVPYKPRDSPASDEPAASGAEEKSWIYHQYLVRDGQAEQSAWLCLCGNQGGTVQLRKESV